MIYQDTSFFSATLSPPLRPTLLSGNHMNWQTPHGNAHDVNVDQIEQKIKQTELLPAGTTFIVLNMKCIDRFSMIQPHSN